MSGSNTNLTYNSSQMAMQAAALASSGAVVVEYMTPGQVGSGYYTKEQCDSRYVQQTGSQGAATVAYVDSKCAIVSPGAAAYTDSKCTVVASGASAYIGTVSSGLASSIAEIARSVIIDSTTTQVTLPIIQGGKTYIYTQPISSFTLSSWNSDYKESVIKLSAGASAAVCAWPSGTLWCNGSSPVIDANKKYAISCDGDGWVVWGEFSAEQQ